MDAQSKQKHDGFSLKNEYYTFQNRVQVADYSCRRIYHYTSAAGLCGILLSKGAPKLRFSRADLLNDVSEGIYFDNLLERELERFGREKDDLFVPFVRNVKSHNASRILRKATVMSHGDAKKAIEFANEDECVTDTYLCCFSLENDSLPMWNYYCKDSRYEGYNICFNADALSDSLKGGKFGKDCRVDLFKIVYDPDKQQKMIWEGLTLLYNAYKYGIEDKELAHYIIRFIDDFRYRFKPKAFEHEKEFRITFTIERNPTDRTRYNYEIYYRDVNGLIVPYVELDMINKRDIESVTVGPLLGQDEGVKYQQSLKEMLNREGYKKIEVFVSEVGVRY